MVREALTLQRLRTMDAREAAAYFVARREEGFTESERCLLAEWLAESAAHARELERVEQAWNWFPGADHHEVLSAMRARAVQPARRMSVSWPHAAAAAAFLAVLSAGLLLILMPDAPAPISRTGNMASRTVRYASTIGQVRQVALPDGSRMTLDARSLALGRFSSADRSIELVRGRAFFDVRPDRSRRFSVTAADRKVVAVGTRFDVELTAGALTVNLAEGKVAVGPADARIEPVTLEPGQQFVESNGTARIRNIGARVEEAIGWQNGLLYFDDEMLGEAAAEMNRYSKTQILIRDPAVSAMRVSGVFRAGESERFARAVAELRPVRTVSRPGVIELASAG